MITLTDELLEKLFKDTTSEVERSHLILPNSKFDKVGQLKKFNKFQLVDLRNNTISDTIPLSCLSHIRFLFLQNNDITKLQGFRSLVNLESLFLDFNKISVLENLERCPLKKLSVKGQRLAHEKHLIIDSHMMALLSTKLTVLNISRNGLTSLRPLRYLRALVELDASGNKVSSVEELEHGTASCGASLKVLELLDNPVLKTRANAVRIIANHPRLEQFNGTPVRDETRSACRHMRMVQHGESSWSPTLQSIDSRLADIPEAMRPKIDQQLIKEVKAKERAIKARKISNKV